MEQKFSLAFLKRSYFQITYFLSYNILCGHKEMGWNDLLFISKHIWFHFLLSSFKLFWFKKITTQLNFLACKLSLSYLLLCHDNIICIIAISDCFHLVSFGSRYLWSVITIRSHSNNTWHSREKVSDELFSLFKFYILKVQKNALKDTSFIIHLVIQRSCSGKKYVTYHTGWGCG